MRAFVELIKSISKLAIISYVAYLSVRGRTGDILSLTHASPSDGALLVVWRAASGLARGFDLEAAAGRSAFPVRRVSFSWVLPQPSGKRRGPGQLDGNADTE